MTIDLKEHRVRVETQRFGPFTFQIGIDASAIESLFLRVNDAHKRFMGSPLAKVANELEKEVVISGIFGTNSIEGGTLSEEETQQALELDPQQVHEVEQRRALNLKEAYRLSKAAPSDPEWTLDLPFIQAVHAEITRDLPHGYDRPGLLRDNPKGVMTHVGDQAHGGRYKPPHYVDDIRLLLESLVSWHDELRSMGVPALIRAPLVHYYYELIHPFWDGNGRVGRVLEATLLHQEGFPYAPFAQAKYYFVHIDKYFIAFSDCRKAAIKSVSAPNTAFAGFFLEGMLVTLNTLHDRVNSLVSRVLFENDLKRLHDSREINARQYAIASQILEARRGLPLSELRRAPWYLALYVKRTSKTKQRDLAGLRNKGLVQQDENGSLLPGSYPVDSGG